jgi:acid phosphatase
MCLACFGTGLFLGASRPALVGADQPAAAKDNAPKPAPPFAMAARLGANLYLQTAAEYRACCLAIYQAAEARLAVLRALPAQLPRPAVVMDLDETVLDNAAFESFLHRYNVEYSDDLWEYYEKNYQDEVTLVPGARQFILAAQRMGVSVVFMSNRTETNRAATAAALRRLGVADGPLKDRLVLKPKGGSSDKSARREQVAARYNVLVYFGDNLRDFSETFVTPRLTPKDGPDAYTAAIRNRFRQVDEARCHWGVDWFVLPNPAYGEWEKLIAADPFGQLRPTSIVPPKLR